MRRHQRLRRSYRRPTPVRRKQESPRPGSIRRTNSQLRFSYSPKRPNFAHRAQIPWLLAADRPRRDSACLYVRPTRRAACSPRLASTRCSRPTKSPRRLRTRARCCVLVASGWMAVVMATSRVRSIANAARLNVQRKRLRDGLAAIQPAFVCFLPELFRSGRKRVARRLRIPHASEASGRVARRAEEHAGPVQG